MNDHPPTFSVARQERFLALLAVGWSIEAAACDAGVARSTVYRLRDCGRAGAGAQAAEFAARFDQLVTARAAKAIAERATEQKPDDGDERERNRAWTLRALSAGDPFIALSPELMALLDERGQRRAIEVSERQRRALARRGTAPP